MSNLSFSLCLSTYLFRYFALLTSFHILFLSKIIYDKEISKYSRCNLIACIGSSKFREIHIAFQQKVCIFFYVLKSILSQN